MTQVKICGITRLKDALAAARYGADALGFIFYAASPRCSTPDTAQEICRSLPEAVVRVGVFVNESAPAIMEIADYCGLDMIQLHGDETPGDCGLLPAERLIKAVSAPAEIDTATSARYPVGAILLDNREAGRYGGTGKPSDWRLAAPLKAHYALILAGGLHAGNIKEALFSVAPDAVDFNSGVEIAPGEKDHEKMRKAIEIARRQNHDATITRQKRPFRRFRGPLCGRDADAGAHRA